MTQKSLPPQNQFRRVKISSEYKGFDLFLIKKPLQCNILIPQTIMLDKYGDPKEWIFNSGKLPHHPILKKRKQNLIPLLILKSLCGKHVNPTNLINLRNVSELREYVISVLNDRKDAEFFNKRKSIEVLTADGDVLQISLQQFLEYVGQNKQAEQGFYQKWKIIQERITNSKLDEYYLVQSVRKNHLIESKSNKFISMSTAYDSNNPFVESMPSKEIQVTDNKTLEAYKFFDSYLNKKFFGCVQELVDCIEKNYKCIVQSVTTKFVIDHNREPHLSSIDQLYIKPALKLSEMRQFQQNVYDGAIKLQTYVRCLHQYLIDHPPRPDLNLHQPVRQQRGHRCKGDFCQAKVLSIPHIPEKNIKLPLIVSSNVRKMNGQLIEAVRKRKTRVIEKLKETRALDLHYSLDDQESSQFSESDDEFPTNVRVCENCFIFYLNVLKHFDLDAYGNLAEKKPFVVRGRLFSQDTKRQSNQDIQKQMLLNRKSDMKSLKILPVRDKIDEISPATELKVKRSASQKLKPLVESPSSIKKEKKDSDSKAKGTLLADRNKASKPKFSDVKSHKLLESKLNTSKAPTKIVKPTNYSQAAQQLLQKLQTLPNFSEDDFINSSKRYYKDNLPQAVERVCHSSEWLEHLYDFMNNSPIWTAPGNRIKKRPQMSLKRLSELTSYPEIVSRSTFLFDTLICDQKTTIPFCMLSSAMVHNHNVPGKPYQNIIILHDIFDSYIEHISMSKQILEECPNTRIILFNIPGQSHTIFDSKAALHPQVISNILDKLLYRLSSAPQQLNIMGAKDTLKLIGFGFGGYLVSTFLSSCRALFPMVKGVMLVNSAFELTERIRSIYESLLEVFEVEDQTTEDNAFLFYNKAINSTQLGRKELEDKSGLNSIQPKGRVYLLKNALKYWDQTSHQHFCDYEGKVLLLYSRDNTLVSKADMLRYTFIPDSDKKILKTRHLVEVEGGHDIQAENYDSLLKDLNQFCND